MRTLLGIGGARRNACAAVCIDGHVEAVCAQERLTRVRATGLRSGTLPAEAVDEVLDIARCTQKHVDAVAVAEHEVRPPESMPCITVDHHQAHAGTAFFTSGLRRAAIVVCDRSAARELSVWIGDGARLVDQQWPWTGRAFASLYTECTELFGLPREGHEHRLEALARLGGTTRIDGLRSTFQCSDGTLRARCGWKADLSQMIEADRCRNEGLSAGVAAAVQHRIGELLVDFCREVRAATGADALCLGGGLFFNTYLTTLVRESGLFEKVFVPINPGNAGLSVGAALTVAGRHGHANGTSPVSPFLGPAYDSEAIKATLDSCKLSYSYVSESGAVDAAVGALTRGQLVGWFQGRMEWGHRSLGHRSILANPCSPYALDNLNCYLRKRERWRPFGVSVRENDAAGIFCGPATSSYMEYEYRLRDDRLRHITPPGAAAIRVQTVPEEDRLFWELHKRIAQATGTGVLVNTSFNGFNEPIACTPRDAVRVFYGTGLDMLVMGGFVLQK